MSNDHKITYIPNNNNPIEERLKLIDKIQGKLFVEFGTLELVIIIEKLVDRIKRLENKND